MFLLVAAVVGAEIGDVLHPAVRVLTELLFVLPFSVGEYSSKLSRAQIWKLSIKTAAEQKHFAEISRKPAKTELQTVKVQ